MPSDLDVQMMLAARATSLAHTCPRLDVGCVIARDNEILAVGANGAPNGQRTCMQDGCIRDEKTGSCTRVRHAEVNALNNLHALVRAEGATAYITWAPCSDCAQALIDAKIARVVWGKSYRPEQEKQTFLTLSEAGISVVQVDVPDRRPAVKAA